MLYDRTVYLVTWAIWLIGLVVLGVAIGAIAEAPSQTEMLTGLAILVACIFPAIALAAKFRVMVDHQTVRIHWGLFAWPKSVFKLEQIDAYRAVKFQPLWEFGGWGSRIGSDGTRCYNLRGHTGVEIRVGKRRYIVGVPDPVRMAEAIQMGTSRPPDPAGDWAPQRPTKE